MLPRDVVKVVVEIVKPSFSRPTSHHRRSILRRFIKGEIVSP